MLEMYSYGIYVHIFLEMQANCELFKEDPLGLQIVTRLEYCWRNTHTHAIIVLGSPSTSAHLLHLGKCDKKPM